VTAALRRAVATLAREFEGRSNVVYKDPVGLRTIGIGCNVDDPSNAALIARAGISIQRILAGGAITEEQVDTLFALQLERAEADVLAILPEFDDLPDGPKIALLDMSFALGRSRLARFSDMLTAVRARDWERAAEEIMDSDRGRKQKRRSRADAEQMRAGAAT